MPPCDQLLERVSRGRRLARPGQVDLLQRCHHLTLSLILQYMPTIGRSHRLRRQVLKRVRAVASYDPVGRDLFQRGRDLRAGSGIAYREPHPVRLPRARKAVSGHVHQPAPAKVDTDIRRKACASTDRSENRAYPRSAGNPASGGNSCRCLSNLHRSGRPAGLPRSRARTARVAMITLPTGTIRPRHQGNASRV